MVFSGVAGQPYDGNMESPQCFENLKGKWETQSQEDCKCKIEKFTVFIIILFLKRTNQCYSGMHFYRIVVFLIFAETTYGDEKCEKEEIIKMLMNSKNAL